MRDERGDHSRTTQTRSPSCRCASAAARRLARVHNKVVHFVLPFGFGTLLYILLERLSVVCDFDEPCSARRAWGIVIVTVALAFTAAGFYEVWEWLAHHELGAPIDVSCDDTVTDMIDNTLGGLGGALVLAWWALRGEGSRRRPGVTPHSG